MKLKVLCNPALYAHWLKRGFLTKTMLVMKLTTILLLATALQVTAKSTAQTITYSSKSVALKKIFFAIEQQTKYVFFYDKKDLKDVKSITVNFKETPLQTVLEEILRDQSLEYEIQGNTIVITQKAIIKKEVPVVDKEIQQLSVTGIVRDSTGAPLKDASVRVKGTQKGTATNTAGEFSIDVNPGDVLIISYVGFQTKEIVIGSQSSIEVNMIPINRALDEVTVIAIGYGTLDKKEVTSAITHLASKDLLQIAGNGALNSIQGKVAGLSITNTAPADPNSSPNIQLRGVSSRNAGLGPLYVINGIPGGNIDNLNPNDIESIDVLKGGAASAIYGTRGSNGVILITTKKGTTQSSALYDGYASIDLPANQIKVLTRDQFLAQNRGVDYGGNTDWFKAVSRGHASQHKHTLQFSGGNSKINFSASFDYRDSKGLDLRSTKKEYGARLSLNHTSTNNLYSISVNIAPRKLHYNQASWDAYSQAITLNPTIPVMDTANSRKYNYINSGFAGTYNPVEDQLTILNGGEGRYLDWSGSFKLNILKNLYTQVTLGEQASNFFNFYFRPSYNTLAINGNGGRNSGGESFYYGDQKNLNWIGNYSFDINRHSFKLMGGYDYNYFSTAGVSAGGQNFPSDALTYNSLGTSVYNLPLPTNGSSGDYTFRTVGSFKNDSKLIAFFARLNYDFANKYYLSASLRHEGSSKMGYDHKWGNFSAVSAGWRISNEQFIRHIPWINELKLRVDYGETGNQDFGNYLSLAVYTGFGYYSFNGTNYQVWGPNQNTNYNLRWEKAENFNLGLDFELFKNKLEGSLNYYIRRNKDLLGNYSVPIPPNVQGSTFVNVGTMKNSGLEIQLNATIISTKNITNRITFAGASNDNVFESFSNDIYRGQSFVDLVSMPAPGSPGYAQRLQEGKRIGSFYMLRSAGVDATGRLMVYDKSGKVIPGNTATADDRQFVGNGLPKFTASLGNTFTWKNLDLSVYLRGAFGYDIFNSIAFYTGTPVTQGGANVLTSAYGSGKYAALTNPETYSTLSDYFLEKGDFVKIDNVTLSYNFKSPIKQINGGRIYFTGRNLYTFTRYTTGDPEAINVNGITPGITPSLAYYPSATQFIAGVQLKF